MQKKKFILAGIVLFMFGLTASSFAQMKCMGHSGGSGHKHNSSDSMAEDTQKMAVEVGNRICPVLNEKIDEKNKATYEDEGKIYNFCCTMCIDEFKKAPQKYIKKVEEELQAQSDGEKQEMNAVSDSQKHMEMEGGHHR